jgi:hypothetical protein
MAPGVFSSLAPYAAEQPAPALADSAAPMRVAGNDRMGAAAADVSVR